MPDERNILKGLFFWATQPVPGVKWWRRSGWSTCVDAALREMMMRHATSRRFQWIGDPSTSPLACSNLAGGPT